MTVSRDFSGEDVYRVLCNQGNCTVDRITGSHYILKWYAPESHEDTEDRTIVVSKHDRLKTGTLRSIMEQAGGKDFESFCAWIDRHS